ncbi:SAM-dependent methyltransferase [Candidatus Sulfidibacterium hydrothermale]|uniref:SAM-dependent methyltransferase n=1 Tax=Candidatus Sulfidibacterium hydrothermale TaxID=2875962 RepID=UPI001F0A41A1|nr:SAM-dependent methyltransferase [Candidatus Sulfidibacterium hydrothermale]UBM62892.1 SAM-dependent methyltransferase [Candidatus Sulfidibacterium hydrothermale]
MTKNKKGTLYLFPVTLGNNDQIHHVIPEWNHQILHTIRYFVVENIRSARRFIRKSGHPLPIDDMQFFELNKHTPEEKIASFLKPLTKGEDMGVLSEAGTPAVADPGAQVVQEAHRQNIRVVPLTGPNSLILALMASGFNGQQFRFHGYLPVDSNLRAKKIRELEQHAQKYNESQLFIETPYRNRQMLETLLKVCRPQTQLCIACNLTLPDEWIISKTIGQWKKEKADFHKKPAVFILFS